LVGISASSADGNIGPSNIFLDIVQVLRQYLNYNINPNVAKAGGLQSQGVKGEAVLDYRKSLTTQDLKFSGFPEV